MFHSDESIELVGFLSLALSWAYFETDLLYGRDLVRDLASLLLGRGGAVVCV